MLYQFIQGLEPALHCKVLKDSPTTFLDAYIIAERISQLDDYLGEMHSSVYIQLQHNGKYNGMQDNNPAGYTPIELNAAFVL